MLVLGAILAAIGLAGTIYGAAQRSTAEYMLASAFGAEETMIVDIAFYAGIVLLALGVIFLIIGIVKKCSK